MSKLNSLHDSLAMEIKDLYSAEKQLVKALPKMAAAAHDVSLKSAFTAHLEETRAQVSRLEEAAKILGLKPTGKVCKGMEGVIAEGSEAMGDTGATALKDLGLIAAASRVEHYEMSGYLTAVSLAEQLGEDHVAELLRANLDEEEAAEDTIRAIAATLLEQSGAESEDAEDEEAMAKK